MHLYEYVSLLLQICDESWYSAPKLWKLQNIAKVHPLYMHKTGLVLHARF
jgi:hypothetical protein